MKINLHSGESLKAVMTGAITTTAPAAKVDYQDTDGPKTAMNVLTGVTELTLLSGPVNGTRSVDGLSILNADTVTQTITISHVQGGTSYPVAIVTLAAGDTLILGEQSGVLNSSGVFKSNTTALSTSFADDVNLYFGTGNDLSFVFSTADASNNTSVIALDDVSQQLHITDQGAKATDWNISAVTHPTVYIHSNTTPATDYLEQGGHDGTTAYVNVAGGTTYIVKAAGNEIADFVQAASAVNGLKFLSSATGVAPKIGSNGTGAEADIGLIMLDSNGNELLEFIAVASATNGLKVTNATTGNPLRIGANGTGATANRGMVLDDSNSNELIICVSTASAVNEITITNAATAGAPEVKATGGDTDINLKLTPKGAGFNLSNGPFQIRSSTAVTATADGTGAGLIPAGSTNVVVTSDDANKQISLPAASVGDEIWILVGATGCELISAVAAHKVNDVTVGATNEAALTATNLYWCKYVATNTWVVVGYTKLGAVQSALVPDSL